MTHDQAVKELARLCQALGKSPDDLTDGQTAAWLDTLSALPYELGRLAVTAVYRSWDRPSFPPPGALTKAARELTHEGIPNAGAYSQDGHGPPWHRTPEAQFAAWRQQKIVAMDDGDYWRYLFDREFRRETEAEWRRQYESEVAVA